MFILECEHFFGQENKKIKWNLLLICRAIVRSNCFHNKGHQSSCDITKPVHGWVWNNADFSVSNSELPQAFMAVHCRGGHVLRLFLDWCRPRYCQGFFRLWIASAGHDLNQQQSFLYATQSKLNWLRSGTRGSTSTTGVTVGPNLSESRKVWTTFQALGDVAFAFWFSVILTEIQVQPQTALTWQILPNVRIVLP